MPIETAMFTGAFLAWRKPIARIGRPLQIGAGAVMVVMGFAMITVVRLIPECAAI